MASDNSGDEWFRRHLIEATQKSTEMYDKAVLTLSGGALSISLLLLERLKPQNTKLGWCLGLAWSLWAISLAGSLFSHWASIQALRAAQHEFDNAPHKHKLGGWMSQITGLLNVIAGLCFLLGVVTFLFFVHANYGGLFHG